jgi:hypothetical protein
MSHLDDTSAALNSGELLKRAISPFPNRLKVAHVNAQSLLCHIDEFRYIFGGQECDVILVSESWLKPNIPSKLVEIDGYDLLRNDRLLKNGGGVAAFVKSALSPSHKLSSDNTIAGRPEFMFFEIKTFNVKMLISVCYRPPHIGFMNTFEDELLQLMVSYNHVAVMGDFNTDLLGRDTWDRLQLTTMFYTCGMTLLPLQATHHTSTSDTWLDLIAVADEGAVVHHGQLPCPGLSAHDLIYLVYDLRCPRVEPKIISYRDYKNINYPALFDAAMNLNWLSIFHSNDVNHMLNILNCYLNYLFETFVPVKRRRITKNPAPWISDDIRQLMRQRDKSNLKARRTKNPADYQNYKQIRNRCKQVIRNAKSRYHRNLISSTRSSSTLWRKLKSIGVGKEGDSPVVSHSLDDLNDHFTCNPVGLDRARDHINSLPAREIGDGFYFSAVTEHDVLKAFNKIKSNAAGVDCLPTKFIKIMLPLILPFITHIINTSIITSVFPTDWKYSVVIPLNKIPNPTTLADYRPISLLPVLSKVLEIIAHEQMSSYLAVEGLIDVFQSGFRAGHSTTTALLRVSDDIRRAMDQRELTLMVLVDLSKAFDSILHPILLHRLESMGFSRFTVSWVRSYLQGRCQCVRFEGSSSRWRSVSRGVPQGSILGPLLFSVYINDVTHVLQKTRHHLYADDLQLYRHFSRADLASAVDDMNADLRRLTEWTDCNGLKINETKTQVIIIGYSRLLNRLDMTQIPQVTVNGTGLDYRVKVKNLGVTFNSTLDWSDHINLTCNKVIAGISTLKKVGHLIPFSVKIMLVKTLIFPFFFYCDLVTIDRTVQLTERLQRAQNYCVRFIFDLQRDEHITPYFQRLNIMRLHESVCLHTLTFLFKLLETDTPSYLAEDFRFMSDIGRGGTRHGSRLLAVPVHRTVMFNKSFLVTACRLWNSLPVEVRRICGQRRFSAAVAAWIGRGGLGRV